MFHFLAVGRAMPGLASLYFVIGLRDRSSRSVNSVFRIWSRRAPNKARVAGGYFNASRTNDTCSLSSSRLRMASNRLQLASIVVSGIFLMYLRASKICKSGTFSFVIVFLCWMKVIV